MNNDPKASEEFHRVKMAYDRLRSIYEEGEGLKHSREDFERGERGRGQGRGNTFKSGVNMNNFRCNIWKSHIFCTLSILHTFQIYKYVLHRDLRAGQKMTG